MATWHQVSGRDCRDVPRLSIGERSGCSSGMLGKREGEVACNIGNKGVVTGDETTPAPPNSSTTKLRPSLFPTGMLPLSLPTISSKSGDRDIVRSNLIAADKFNDLIAIQIRWIAESFSSGVECFEKFTN